MRKKTRVAEKRTLNSFLDEETPDGTSFLNDPFVDTITFADLHKMNPAMPLHVMRSQNAPPMSFMPESVQQEFNANLGVIANMVSSRAMRPENEHTLAELRKAEEARGSIAGATSLSLFKPRTVEMQQRAEKFGGAQRPEDVLHSHLIDETLLFMPSRPMHADTVKRSTMDEVFCYESVLGQESLYSTLLELPAHRTSDSFATRLPYVRGEAEEAITVGQLHLFIRQGTSLKFFRAQFVRDNNAGNADEESAYSPLLLLTYRLDATGRYFWVVAVDLLAFHRSSVKRIFRECKQQLDGSRQKSDASGGYSVERDYACFSDDEDKETRKDDDVRNLVPFYVKSDKLPEALSSVSCTFLYHYYTTCQCTIESIESTREKMRRHEADVKSVQASSKDAHHTVPQNTTMNDETLRLLHSTNSLRTNVSIGQRPSDANDLYRRQQ